MSSPVTSAGLCSWTLEVSATIDLEVWLSASSRDELCDPHVVGTQEAIKEVIKANNKRIGLGFIVSLGQAETWT